MFRIRVVFLSLLLFSGIASAADKGASIRPISDFLSTQGTYCFDDGAGGCLAFTPPVANFVAWTTQGCTRAASIDYAGLADAWIKSASSGTHSFGTTFSGQVTERPLASGQAEVTVLLHTRNALAWAVDVCSLSPDIPPVFGNRASEVLYEGAAHALGDSFLHVVFRNTAPGATLPDLVQLLYAPQPRQDLVSIYVTATANGELHSNFGVEEGLPGLLQVQMTGTLFRSRWRGATADGAPAEFIKLHVVGR